MTLAVLTGSVGWRQRQSGHCTKWLDVCFSDRLGYAPAGEIGALAGLLSSMTLNHGGLGPRAAFVIRALGRGDTRSGLTLCLTNNPSLTRPTLLRPLTLSGSNAAPISERPDRRC